MAQYFWFTQLISSRASGDVCSLQWHGDKCREESIKTVHELPKGKDQVRTSDWPFLIWLEFEISCKVVEIVLFFPHTVSEGQSTAFSFAFVDIWNLLPLSFLSSAGHLEFIHAITPSSFSCCITVCQWPLFSALPFLCLLSSAGKLRGKKTHRNTKNPTMLGFKTWGTLQLFPLQ